MKNVPCKICFFGHKRIPSREGGVEVVVEELSVRLVKQGYDVTCFNRRGHHVSGAEFDGKIEKNFKGIHIRTVPSIDKKGLSAITSAFFSTLMACFGNYRIVHIHAEGSALFCFFLKLFRKKIIVTCHGLDHQRNGKWGRFARKCILQGEKQAVKHADKIIVLSHNIQNYFKTVYGRNTVFIPNGVNKPVLRKPKLIEQLYGLKRNSYFLFLGRIVPEKGIEYLIDAFMDINTDKTLVIAGGNSDSQNFFNQIKHKAHSDKRIIFTGFIQGEILEELYSNAYVYVLPSDLEGMPLSLLEAMSYGNCCIISDIPESSEVVENHALIFRKSDTNDLRKKLEYTLSHEEEVNKFKNEASEFICSKYNWDHVVERTIQLYQEK